MHGNKKIAITCFTNKLPNDSKRPLIISIIV
jgi:hypothetical protein